MARSPRFDVTRKANPRRDAGASHSPVRSTGNGPGRPHPQAQKQALTQIRGAGSFEEQPHIGFGAEHSAVELHSL